MLVEQARTPLCSVKLDVKKPACGKPMFRVGTAGNNAWVCPECDRVPVNKALDAPDK